MILFRLIRTELIKLKRSLIRLIVLAIPAMMLILEVAIISTGNSADEWLTVAMGGTAIYGFFLLPMTVTAVTALQAQLEHGSALWSYTLSQPHSRVQVFTAKAIVTLLILSLITLLIGVALVGGGVLAGILVPEEALAGEIPITKISKILFLMILAGLLMIAIQFTVAMRFSSFAVPVVLGIFGTFVGVIATSAQQGIYFPWLMPVNVQSSDPARIEQVVLTGLIGGIIVFVLGCTWLSRRDWK